jgi:hypothetical protein
MFWIKKPNPAPLGVRLDEIQAMLATTSIKTSLKNGCLLARHDNYTVRIDVNPPKTQVSENGPIRAVVRLTAELPAPLQQIFTEDRDSTIAIYNPFAALNAVYTDDGKILTGSRLTIYEQEDAWRALHLPLLAFTIIGGTEAILGALIQTMSGESPVGGESDWNQQDLEQAENTLNKFCVCTGGGLGLSAEFSLHEGSVSGALGHRQTALFQQMADQPHPELGGGLFCLLQMPHQVPDAERLNKICSQLNKMEMEGDDLPPHFGAWCTGKIGNNPAYVSFLPNALHNVSGIAVNAAIWAKNRAEWANRTLCAMGVTA